MTIADKLMYIPNDKNKINDKKNIMSHSFTTQLT